MANRRAADEQLETWANSPEDALQLTVILCDVNGLKAVNDTSASLAASKAVTTQTLSC